VKVQSNFPKSERSPVVFEPKTARNDPRIATTDSLGNVWFVYFDGRVDSIQLGNIPQITFLITRMLTQMVSEILYLQTATGWMFSEITAQNCFPTSLFIQLNCRPPIISLAQMTGS
jgi:hypothetical protein